MWTDAKFDKAPTRFVNLSILLARFADAEGLTYQLRTFAQSWVALQTQDKAQPCAIA